MKPKELEALFKSINKLDDHLGLELSVSEQGQTEYRLKIHQDLMSSPAAVHGGAISAMMDATLGIQVLCHAATSDLLCSTVEFKINFLSGAALGETLIGRAKLDYTGKRLVVASADIIEEKTNRIVAKGLGTFNLYPMNKREDVESKARAENPSWS